MLTAVSSVAVVVLITVLADQLAVGAGMVMGAAVGVPLGLVVVRWRRRLDGDLLGATIELTMLAALAASALVARAVG
jgi:hypothetical protein